MSCSWQADAEGQIRLYRSAGCSQCNNSGYHGRIAIHELLLMNEEIRRLVMARADCRTDPGSGLRWWDAYAL